VETGAIKLSKVLDMISEETFISIQWDFNEEGCFAYQGTKELFFDYDEETVVTGFECTIENGLILSVATPWEG